MDDELEKIRQEKLESLKAKRRQAPGNESSDLESTRAGADGPIHVDGADHLEETVASHDVVLVDFYADWCGPCKMLEPIVETLAAETPAAVAKVDVDAHQSLAGQFQVRGVPTLVLFANGDPVERVTGVRSEEELRGLIGRYA